MAASTLLTNDPWLSSVMGNHTLRVSCTGATLHPAQHAELGTLGARANSFAYGKVDPSDIDSAMALQNAGFYLVDTNILFSRDLSPAPAGCCSDFKVRFVSRTKAPELQSAIGAVASDSFQFTRFHLDPKVKKALANKIKREWVMNFFSGQRGDHLAIAEDGNGKPIGFLLSLKSGGRTVIDLIATLPEWQGKGVGRTLISLLAEEYGPAIDVGTQLANKSSLKFYQALGFRVTDAKYVFHYHSPKAL